jgi:hypothetical protein
MRKRVAACADIILPGKFENVAHFSLIEIKRCLTAYARITVVFAAVCFVSEFVASCGGGGNGGGGTPPTTPTITSVAVSCSPNSISTSQTSACTPTVSGTGSYSAGVTWSATDGTITSTGVFTPSAAGTATITATSTEDSTSALSRTRPCLLSKTDPPLL